MQEIPRPCRIPLLHLLASDLHCPSAGMSLELPLPGCRHTWAVHGRPHSAGAASPSHPQPRHQCPGFPAVHQCTPQIQTQLHGAGSSCLQQLQGPSQPEQVLMEQKGGQHHLRHAAVPYYNSAILARDSRPPPMESALGLKLFLHEAEDLVMGHKHCS